MVQTERHHKMSTWLEFYHEGYGYHCLWLFCRVAMQAPLSIARAYSHPHSSNGLIPSFDGDALLNSNCAPHFGLFYLWILKCRSWTYSPVRVLIRILVLQDGTFVYGNQTIWGAAPNICAIISPTNRIASNSPQQLTWPCVSSHDVWKLSCGRLWRGNALKLYKKTNEDCFSFQFIKMRATTMKILFGSCSRSFVQTQLPTGEAYGLVEMNNPQQVNMPKNILLCWLELFVLQISNVNTTIFCRRL